MRLSDSLFLTAVLPLAVGCGTGPAVDTRTFELKYLRGPEASRIISPYVYVDRREAKGMMSFAGTTITVRETRDNLDKIARVLAQYDRPRPLVRLTFHLIQADGARTTDPALADVEAMLRKLFRFRGYRMVEEGVFSATEGGDVSQAMGGYRVGAGIHRVSGMGDSATVELRVHLTGRTVEFSTIVGLPAGKTAVLGNVGQDPRGTLILTVRPELVTASP
jgi:hypothetical protein